MSCNTDFDPAKFGCDHSRCDQIASVTKEPGLRRTQPPLEWVEWYGGGLMPKHRCPDHHASVPLDANAQVMRVGRLRKRFTPNG